MKKIIYKFIFFLKIIIDAIRDTRRISKFFNLRENNNFLIIPKLFFIRLVYSFYFIRNRIKIKIHNSYSFSEYLLSSVSSVDLANVVDEKGFSKVYGLKDNLILNIKKEIFSTNNIMYKKDTKLNKNLLFKSENEDEQTYFNRLIKLNISRITGFINLNKPGVISDLLLSKPFLSLAQNYLNTNQFSINASYFISNPITELTNKEKYANAQYFHWDNDFTKFFKVYVYLTDVDNEGGPHVFIPYTHKKKLPQHSLARLYSDKSILNSYPENIKFLGKAGSIFFEDSYGLHKGEAPTGKSRIILNIHYGRGKILYSNNDIFYKN
jgi:hypothetical protein